MFDLLVRNISYMLIVCAIESHTPSIPQISSPHDAVHHMCITYTRTSKYIQSFIMHESTSTALRVFLIAPASSVEYL